MPLVVSGWTPRPRQGADRTGCWLRVAASLCFQALDAPYRARGLRRWRYYPAPIAGIEFRT